MTSNWKTKNCIIFHILKGRSNSFLIKNRTGYILVDNGTKNSFKKLSGIIDQFLVNDKLSCLILTHTHYDHVENTSNLKEKYECPVIVNSSEADNLKNGTNIQVQGTNLLTKLEINLVGKYLQPISKYKPAEPDILVNNSYNLNKFGFNGYILHTPGHSPGSMSVIIDNEIALVGDTMFGVIPKRAFPPFADNVEIMIDSWEKLLDTDCKLFLPGHGKPISRKLLEKEFNKYK